MLTTRLQRHWKTKTLVSLILLPLSLLYFLTIFLRSKLYKLGLLKASNWSTPIIVVGNIMVGGTGKTPLVGELVKAFIQKGFKPGIVSRGYGGKYKKATLVHRRIPSQNDSQSLKKYILPLLLRLKVDCKAFHKILNARILLLSLSSFHL